MITDVVNKWCEKFETVIKAQELRVGNIVIRQGEEIVVCGADIKWLEDGSYKGIKGISLTEEWLLKFGELNWIHRDSDGYYVLIGFKKIYIKFVHSLQNMYFCIGNDI